MATGGGNEKDLWWIPDDQDVWTLANQSGVVLPNGLVSFVVHKTKKVTALPLEKCLPAVKDQGTPDDLIQLPDVNPASILACVRARFAEQKIYTSIGMVLMSINPFRLINGLYGKEVIGLYQDPMARNLPAHVYMVPSRAYYDMCLSGQDQSILISGESGAGKTEATKQCLYFLTEVANHTMATNLHNQNNQKNESTVNISDISERIIAVSPILEAFGNAQTLRNPNSSRFGKWMILNFDHNNVIHSSNITSYLLEKSRVTQRDLKERNYHIFYQVLRGINRDQLLAWHVDPSTKAHRYLSQGSTEAPDLNDSKVYKETYQAFLKMGFFNDDIMHLFKIVMAILQLGDIVFNPTKDGEGSTIANNEVVEQAAKKLGISQEILTYALCNRSIESGKAAKKSIVAVQLNVQKAQETRDSLARNIYDKIFLDIISTINQKSKDNSNVHESLVSDRGIGLLDIFGFEIFVENSFEQLCINYCNEMLQNHFNFVIFTAEKNLYNQEGVTCETIEFRDNSDVIREIEGAFKALDEEARIPKGSSKTWFDKLKRGAKLLNIAFPTRRQGDIFAVKHYAGNVDYNALGFLEKNIETLNNDLMGAMSSSADAIIHRVFSNNQQHGDAPLDRRPSTLAPASLKESFSSNFSDLTPPKDPAGLSRGRSSASVLSNKSLSWRFINQLAALMSMLKRTKSHFIRCIKSNDDCAPQRFESSVVYKQLVYSGVFEVVKIQQSGLPCRLLHDEFLQRYRCLAPSDVRFTFRMPQDLIGCLSKRKYDLGNTKIGNSMTFYKSHEQRVLEAKRDALLKLSSTIITRFLRMKTRRYLYKNILRHFKYFNHFNSELELANATESFESFVGYCSRMHKLVGYEVLAHLILSLERELSLLDRRVQLIKDAQEALKIRSKEGVIGLEQIVSGAIDLEITSHQTVLECKSVVQKYYRAIEFVSLVHSTAENSGIGVTKRSSVVVSALTVLTSEQIAEGLDLLQQMNDLVPNALEALDDVSLYKAAVDKEIEARLRPLAHLFAQATICFDARTGNIAFKHGVEGQMAFGKLKKLVETLEHEEFKCLDMKLLFEDCDIFITLMDEHVAFHDAQNGMDLIQHAAYKKSTNSTFSAQIHEFKLWAEIQLSAENLRRLLTEGNVGSGATVQYEIQYEEIAKLVEKLKGLTEPTENLQMVIRVGDWVVKLRKAFIAADWELLEETVALADQDGVENFIFDDFPDCIEELNSCQWQVIYHGFYSDLVAAITEPVFRLISFETATYFILVSNLEEELAMIEDIKSFASTETSPKLLELILLLEKLIQLRSLVYSKEIDFSRALIQDIGCGQGNVIKTYFFTESISAELSSCEKLLKKMEYENQLDIALANGVSGAYEHREENEQVKYSSTVNLSTGIVALQDVLQNLLTLSASYDVTLQSKISVANIILSGRRYLQMDETDVHTPWPEYLKSFQSSVEALKDEENNQYANYSSEFEVILQELHRRMLLHGCQSALQTQIIVGQVDVDLRTDSTLLSDLFHKYNSLMLILKKDLEKYPVNLHNLARFTKEMLKFRKYLNDHGADPVWDLAFIDRQSNKLRKMKHGGGLNLANVQREIELVTKECEARIYVNNLMQKLQQLPLNLTDSNTNLNTLVDPAPLTQAVEQAKSNQGSNSKKLVVLANTLLSIIKHLQLNETEKIDINIMDGIATQYHAHQLNSSNINLVFDRVRIHNFLKSLNEALLAHRDAPESLLLSINKVKSSLKAIPPKFIPWLHSAYLYCYLSDSLLRKSWVEIIEVSQELDEYMNSELKFTLLSMQKENSAFDNNFSDAEKFLSSCTEFKCLAFQRAIQMKTEQDAMNQHKQSVLLSPVDTLKAQIRKEDSKSNMYGVGALRNAGYSDLEIAKLNLPAKLLWAYNFECSLLRKVSYPASQLLQAGYGLDELYRSGYKILELFQNNVSVAQLLKLGLSVSQLRQAGISNEELLNSQDIPISEIKDLENEPRKLFKLGYTLHELVQAGFTVSELRGAGFSATEIYHAGLRNVQDFIVAGFPSSRLTVVFPLKQLASSGSLSYLELRNAGVTDGELIQAGFEVEVERRALSTLFQKMQGSQWKCQVNWNSSKPLKMWHGIATQPDLKGVERVVSIDLVDNNLQGTVPEEIGLLLGLRRLRLSGNSRLNLSNVPDNVLKLIQQNKIVNDLIPYNSAQKLLSRKMSFNHSYSSVLSKNSAVVASDSILVSNGDKTPSKPFAGLQNDTSPQSHGNLMQTLASVTEMLALAPEESKETEREALVEIFKALRGEKWRNNLNWCTQAPISSWYGVKVNKEGFVISLLLPSNNLRGYLPDAIGSLQYLEELDMRLNQVSGLIPQGLAYCFSLKKAYLQMNKLCGSIPNVIEELTSLVVLDLRSNALQGEPPYDALGNLKNLRYLGFYSNHLAIDKVLLQRTLPSCKIV